MSDAPPQDGMRVRPWRGLRTLLILLSILLFLAGSLGGLYWLAKAKATRARAQWKGPALERLAGMSVTNKMIRQELEDLAAGKTAEQRVVRDNTDGARNAARAFVNKLDRLTREDARVHTAGRANAPSGPQQGCQIRPLHSVRDRSPETR